MCLQAGPALGFDPPERVAVGGAGDAIAWARTIPDFGFYAEIYALFLLDGALSYQGAFPIYSRLVQDSPDDSE